jgi:hypothetical protein
MDEFLILCYNHYFGWMTFPPKITTLQKTYYYEAPPQSQPPKLDTTYSNIAKGLSFMPVLTSINIYFLGLGTTGNFFAMSQTSDHPQEYLAKFGYRLEMKVQN